MPEEAYTFGQAVEGLQPFGTANNTANPSSAVDGLEGFRIGALVAPEIKFGSFLLRYDITTYNQDYLFYGLEQSNGDYRIRRVDRDQVQTWALGAWEDRETLIYT